MTREEAIEWMEETIQDAEKLLDKCSPELKEEILEQNEVFKIAITALRSMQEAGEPLRLEQLREVPHGKIKDSTLQNIANRANEIASPPAHIDRSKWTAEWVPMTDDDGCVWLECSACEYDLDSLEEPHPFCPSCGRAMMPEAWAELKRRVRR